MNLDYYSARMDRLLEDYLNAAWQQERNRKPSELFGLKFGPSDDPLHDRFAQDMAAVLSDFASEHPDSTALRTVLAKLFSVAKENPDPKSAHWMLVAIQGLARDLIPGLSREDAAALVKDYESDDSQEYGGSHRDIFDRYPEDISKYHQGCDYQEVRQSRRCRPQQHLGHKPAFDSLIIGF